MISSAKSIKSTEPLANYFSLSLLLKLGALIRLTSLSLLFAGSAAIVFAAITLVKTGEAHGLSVSQAASANAPVFIQYSKVVAAACVALLMAEAIDSFFTRHLTKLKLSQYIASALCCLCGFIFALIIAPHMDQLLPYINMDPQAHESFQHLHHYSRFLFSGMILFAWASLVMPVFFSMNAMTTGNDLNAQRNTE